ncbi:UTP--glucose-1-phosphate uridylyltransferase, partial [Streptococcus suis]
FGFLKTTIDYALQHPQVKNEMKDYLITLGKELEQAEPKTKD